MSGGRQRAFLALPPDPEAAARLRASVDALRGSIAGIRWVRPEGLHLTLRFLGPAEPERLARVADRVAAAAAAAAPAVAAFGPLGLVPARGAPRVLWVALPLPPPLLALQQACDEAARADGFAAEERAFSPHVTLGRWKERAPRPELPAAHLGLVRLEAVVLYHSRLERGGAVYTPLRTMALGGGA